MANLEVLLHRNPPGCVDVSPEEDGDFCGEQLLGWVLYVAFPTSLSPNQPVALMILNSFVYMANWFLKQHQCALFSLI